MGSFRQAWDSAASSTANLCDIHVVIPCLIVQAVSINHSSSHFVFASLLNNPPEVRVHGNGMTLKGVGNARGFTLNTSALTITFYDTTFTGFTCNCSGGIFNTLQQTSLTISR